MRTTLRSTLAVLGILCIPSAAQCQTAIESVEVSSTYVKFDEQPKTLRVTVRVSKGSAFSSALIVKSADTFSPPLGALYDDGTHGDSIAGDSIYTGAMAVNEPRPALVSWSVQFNALPAPATRTPQRRADVQAIQAAGPQILVQAPRQCEDAIATLRDGLSGGDLEAAAAVFLEIADKDRIRRSAPAARSELVRDLQASTIVSQNARSCVVTVPLTIGARRIATQFLFVRAPEGDFRISSW